MDRRPRRYGHWLTLAALAVLLAAVAALQYSWIGEIGRADSERRQAQLDRAARRFVTGFDRELGRLMMALVFEPGPIGQPESMAPRDARALLLERLSALSRTDLAPLVSGVLLLSRRSADEVTLEECAPDGSGCRTASWTATLAPLRRRLLESDPPRIGGFAALRRRLQEVDPRDRPLQPPRFFRMGELIEDPLGLIAPLFDAARALPGQPWTVHSSGLVLIRLDRDVLRERLLPQLAEAQFGPLRESEFVLAVLRRADRSLVYTSDASMRADQFQRGDVELGLPGLPGQAALSGAGADAGPPGPPAPGAFVLGWRQADGPRRPADDAPWLLVVRHRGGSLEHAVANVRRRNLAIGFGVLVLLGAAGVLLTTGAQRARELARQQLELVAGVSHELNTPLAAIRSAGQNLAAGIVTDPAHVRRYGALIEKEGSRLGTLVGQVLDFAGIESGSRAFASEPVSWADVVGEVLGELRLVLDQSGLAVANAIPRDLPEVRGDPAALRRVIANLLTNAAKFAACGGRVTLKGARAADGRSVVIRVEDRGPGIAAADRERVFEPFYRGAAAERNETPGSGLGLSLVRRIVSAHGGRVHVEEAEGGGTAVVVALPVFPTEAEEAP